MTDTTLGWTSYATDTTELGPFLGQLEQLLAADQTTRRNRAARRVRKAGRALFTGLVVIGLLTIAAVTVSGPGVILDVADMALAR